MNNKNEKIVRPRDLTKPLSISDIKKRNSRNSAKIDYGPNRRNSLNFWKKSGLFMACIVVLSALGGNASAKSKEFELKLRSSANSAAASALDTYHSFLNGFESASNKAVDTAISQYEKSKPVVREATKVVMQSATEISNEFDEIKKRLITSGLYEEPVAEVFPAPGPVSKTDLDYSIPDSKFAKTTNTPVTRPLNLSEVTRVLDINEIESNDSIDNIVSSSSSVESPNSIRATQTPLATVDTLVESNDLTKSEFSTFAKPFESRGVNEVISELNLSTLDLFFPDTYRMQNFTDVIDYPEVLPIFTKSSSEHEKIVIEEVNKFNQENSDLQFSPNIFLALIQIETDGANVQSHMAAKGIMQVTAPVAEAFNYTAEDMFNPKINVRVGIKYFAEGYRKGIEYGLSEMEALKYASMYYNGGPGNANRYFGFQLKGEDPKIREDRMRIKTQEDVINYLNKYVGDDMAKGYEYYTYGPNMTKVETIKYAESFERLIIEQKIAIELKKKGLSDEEIRKQLTSSRLLLQLKSYIKYNQPEYTDIFAEREIAEYILYNFANGNLETEIRSTAVDTDSKGSLMFKLIRF